MASKDSKYPYPSSYSGGVKPLSIRGVYEDERYRLTEEYTDEERMWRKQWYKDQILSPNEPRYVPELEKELKNPIRRMLSAPWKFLESKMAPVTGAEFATNFRYVIPKLIVLTGFTYLAFYHLKYNQNDWTRHGGWRVTTNRPVVVPGDPGFPAKRDRTEPQQYYDRGFSDRKVFKD